MVLYKRRPVIFDAPKTFAADAELWEMPFTGEIFSSYEEYSRKYDYYNQKSFTCEITGHTNLRFRDALDSETSGSRAIDTTFPEQLRAPILRKVQFCTISRIDELVNYLYEAFKEDFFPGERVTVQIEESGDKLQGAVRDKTSIPELRGSDGSIQRPARSTYYVEIDGTDGYQQLANNKQLSRGRRAFSKNNLRPFLRHNIHRERWEGAPWLVKESVAKRYHIDTNVPLRLQYDTVMAERKEAAAQKRELKAAEKMAKLDPSVAAEKRAKKLKKAAAAANGAANGQKQSNNGSTKRANGTTSSETAQPKNAIITSGIYQVVLPDRAVKGEDSTDLPQVIKFPIEDLEVMPRQSRIARPPLKFLSGSGASQGSFDSWDARRDISEGSVGALLEIWNTLNVHVNLLVIDSFTFDDFVDAMLYSSHEVDCELFNEIHCAVLKTLADKDGDPDESIPALPEEEDDDEDDEEEEEDNQEEKEEEGGALKKDDAESVEDSIVSVPLPELGKSRRTSARLAMAKTKTPDPPEQDENSAPEEKESAFEHRADDMVGEYSWSSRIKDQDFKDGGWQVIMVGLLHHMSLVEEEKQLYPRILSRLAPISGRPTREAARRNYMDLDVNLRIAALETATLLAVCSKPFKEFMEKRNVDVTNERKTRQDLQKHKKSLMEELRALDEERKILRPVQPEEAAEASLVNGHQSEIKSEIPDEVVVVAETPSEEEPTKKGKGRRTRVSDRAGELKRKREEEDARREKEKKAKREEAKLEKEQAGYRKVLRDIDRKNEEIKNCENDIILLEERLRENASHRTRLLGRDRFMNRYYWFERNGMPFAGSPDSSTASYGYANGRLWVQGPDDLEREGFLELDKATQQRYRLFYGMSTHERRGLEEGATILQNAREWGFYDDPDSLDKLIEWLDDRGERERALIKEIQMWKDKVAMYMDKFHAYYRELAEKKAKLEEPIIGIATRKKTFVDLNAMHFPCLAWTNSAAKRKLGHLHSEGAPPKRTKASGKAKMLPAVPDKPTTTRQGTRYR